MNVSPAVAPSHYPSFEMMKEHGGYQGFFHRLGTNSSGNTDDQGKVTPNALHIGFADPVKAYAATKILNDTVNGVKINIDCEQPIVPQRGWHADNAVGEALLAFPGVSSLSTSVGRPGSTGFHVTTRTAEQAKSMDSMVRDEIFGYPVKIDVAGGAQPE